MTIDEAWQVLNAWGFTKDDPIRTPGRFIERGDINWTSYSNPTKGHKVCIFVGKPIWSDWEPVWEDAFHIAIAKHLQDGHPRVVV